MNYERYPWLRCVGTSDAAHLRDQAEEKIQAARKQYLSTGAVTFPEFVSPTALSSILKDCAAAEDEAFTTDDKHTPHQLPVDPIFQPPDSVRNLQMRTQVASIAYDELPKESELVKLYRNPKLLALVSAITGRGDGSSEQIYLSEDSLGACSVNVFRASYAHSFHFDESEFSTTIMIREANLDGSGLFQYTPPLRETRDDLVLEAVGQTIRMYCAEEEGYTDLAFPEGVDKACCECPPLHTLEFRPGTLSIFSGSKSLHRVTEVQGSVSRLTAVLTFSKTPGFRNSKAVQEMFWGRSTCT
uniref:Fe2OG dioxygenase domain-containing protein n=1 Tax=Minutocellus polymorphus TaxID=265543 RepID=A0A7S0APW5_9STRA|mmetsp:Transcript_19683/g.32550  ORF Transcript_19683/g.32550 Transcript_19683/m.32550 type:complete len:300 (+) Transcript_19683:103-1002(+)|eukprot:CAMPEP_0197726232 /NCGR_PEP_ID=MMETSP1434-20131217/14293_1 /TAXON_ID=265543 /ORGANISM="Minutocellus polymorphus, Strain CCMP3303" /LENGTH=299 /DNA_ID=CAMNT_0043312089 /DNA_START=45 /DNA_END=944 /DNA_ORIENTATION=+